jgi:resuscitation-promoting factor RpfB
VRRQSSALTRGRTKVDRAGVAGVRTVTYRVVRQDGKVTSRTKTASALVRKPVTQVIVVGTKAPKRSSSGGGGSGVWDKIAQCESGGNWSINTGNGFYGGLQFSLGTWRAYGGTGMPNKASKATQIAIARMVQADAGWGAWPACSSKLGLR